MTGFRSRVLTVFAALGTAVALAACSDAQNPVSPISGELSLKPQIVPLVIGVTGALALTVAATWLPLAAGIRKVRSTDL